jgi:hypothetical protein
VVGIVRDLIDANHPNRAIKVVEAIVACYRSEEAFANGLHVMTKGTPWTQKERADIKAAVLKERGRDRGDAPLNR